MIGRQQEHDHERVAASDFRQHVDPGADRPRRTPRRSRGSRHRAGERRGRTQGRRSRPDARRRSSHTRPTETPASRPRTTHDRQRRRRSAPTHIHAAVTTGSPPAPRPQRTTPAGRAAGRLLAEPRGAGPLRPGRRPVGAAGATTGGASRRGSRARVPRARREPRLRTGPASRGVPAARPRRSRRSW